MHLDHFKDTFIQQEQKETCAIFAARGTGRDPTSVDSNIVSF